MNTKFSLAIIALVGIGVFALPSTMSLFAGQHSFYNIDATGNQVPCQKCHGDVKAELGQNVNTNPAAGPLTDGPHKSFKCEYCHRVEAGSASGDNAYAKIPYNNSVEDRYILIPVADLEAGNYPNSITLDELFVDSDTTIGGVKLMYGKGKASPSGVSPGPYVLGNKADRKIFPTYNTGTGLPLDNVDATKYGGLDLSKATVTNTGVVNLDNAGSKAVNPGSSYHAASLVSCMECHGGEVIMGHQTRVLDGTTGLGCPECHYGNINLMTTLGAGGFGLTSDANDTGATEAHNAWVKYNDTINRFGGAYKPANNGACIGCHTHVAIDINFQKGYKLSFDAIESNKGVYSVSNTAVEGTVNISIYGNGSGETFAVGDKSYTWTPTKPMYITDGTNNKTMVPALTGESSDSYDALTTP